MSDEARDHVEHYVGDGIETIDFIYDRLGFEGTIAFIVGNMLKYSSRAFHKGSCREDIKKIGNYARIAEELWQRHEREESDDEPFGFGLPSDGKKA